MNGILVVVLVFFALAAGLGGVAYVTYQKKMRRAKAIERGLKMVPILIRLPPPSSDTASGSRDIREVMREKTAQAEILYNLLSGTATEGFKSNFYGQRHIALELIVTDGLVHFYAAVPVALVSIVKKAIITAYPGARLEEVEDHNIFNQEGRLAATLGGEMVLRAESAYPIATYEQLERDPMEALLTTVSALEKEDGVAIQIMLRPAGPEWVKRAVKLADGLRKGRPSDLQFSAMDLAKAVVKAPEQRRDEERSRTGGGPDVSNLQLSQVERIEEKTKHAGFEILIRVIVSTVSVARSQQLLRDISTAYALFEAPGLNGFKFLPAFQVQGLVTAFIFRFFPPELKNNVLNSSELATLFHLPDSQFTPSMSVERQQSKQVDGPVQMPTVGLLFGYNEFRGVKKEIRLSPEDRRRHTYILGQTGTGKSTMLENLAVQDMLSGNGFAFIDPHGDSAEKLLAMVPKDRAEDVIYFNPADGQYPLGLNLFEFTDPAQKDFIVQETINMLYKLYDPGHTGIIGPRYEHWYRNAALTLMSDPNGSTFIEIPKVFTDTEYLKQKFKYLKDPTVIDFWTKEMGQTSDYHKSEMLGWFVSKFGAFQNNEIMRNIIGQTKSAFNIRDVMDNKKILIVNLSKGRIGELNSQLLGMIFVIKFQAAAMSRADAPEDQRADFALYVDEFQNFATDSFATILSEARKYRLNLIVANQFIGQLSNEIRDAVFGNIGTIVAHRMGPDDAEFMVKQFAPVFDASDLVNIPNFNAAMRLMIGGLPSQPFTIHNSAPLGIANAELGMAIKQLSAAKYGNDKRVVEADIMNRYSGRPVPAPSTQAAPAGAAAAAVAPILTTAGTPAPAPASAAAPSPMQAQFPQQSVVSIATAPVPAAINNPAQVLNPPLQQGGSFAPSSQLAGNTVAAQIPPITGVPIATAANMQPVGQVGLSPAAAPAYIPPNLEPSGIPQAAVPPREAMDSSDELAQQIAAAAKLNPRPAASAGGIVPPPPIGAPPVELPGNPIKPSVIPSAPNTLSFSDITGGKAPNPQPARTMTELDNVPLLGAAAPISAVQEETGLETEPEPAAVPQQANVSDGRPLEGDPYSNIDIMSGPAPAQAVELTNTVVPEEGIEEAPIPEPARDGTPLPDDPYGGIDLLGESDSGLTQVQTPVAMGEPPIPSPDLQPSTNSQADLWPDPSIGRVESQQPVQVNAAPSVVKVAAAPAVPMPTPLATVATVPQAGSVAQEAPVELSAPPVPAPVPPVIPVAPVQQVFPAKTTTPVQAAPVHLAITQPLPVASPAIRIQEQTVETRQPDSSLAPQPAVQAEASIPEPQIAKEFQATDEPFIHFVDPAAETLLNTPDEELPMMGGMPSLEDLPDGVKLIDQPAAKQNTSQVKAADIEVPVAPVPTVAAVTSPNVATAPVAAAPEAEKAPVIIGQQEVAPKQLENEKALDQVVAVADTIKVEPSPSEPSDNAEIIAAREHLADALSSAGSQNIGLPKPAGVELKESAVAAAPMLSSAPDLKVDNVADIVPVQVPAEVSTSVPTPLPDAKVATPVEREDKTPKVTKVEPANEPAAENKVEDEPLKVAASPDVPAPELPVVKEPNESEKPLVPIAAESSAKEEAKSEISEADQVQKTEHEIDDLLSVSLIHSDNTPGHHRLPEPMVILKSEDESGIDLELNAQEAATAENVKKKEEHLIAKHHGLKVIQPLENIVPTKERFAKELAEMSENENSDSPDEGQEPQGPPPAAEAPIVLPQTVSTSVKSPVSAPSQPQDVKKPDANPTPPKQASELESVIPQPIAVSMVEDDGMPQAHSLAADDVARAREAEQVKIEEIPELPAQPQQQPRKEEVKAETQIIRHTQAMLPEHEDASNTETKPEDKPEAQPANSGMRRKRRRGGNDTPKQEDQKRSTEEAKPVPSKLIMPSGEKPKPAIETTKTEKPKKLSPGEVYVDESGNVIIGE